MRILPINNSYSKPQFKGKINECDFLKKALTHFNEADIICQNKLKMSDKIFWKFQFCEN